MLGAKGGDSTHTGLRNHLGQTCREAGTQSQRSRKRKTAQLHGTDLRLTRDKEVAPLNYCLASRVRWGIWPAMSALFVALLVLFATPLAARDLPAKFNATTKATSASSSSLGPAAHRHNASVEAIVQLQPSATPEQVGRKVRSLGGRVTGDLHIIHGLAVHMSAPAAKKLAREHDLVRAVSLNAGVKPEAVDTTFHVTRYDQSIYAPNACN